MRFYKFIADTNAFLLSGGICSIDTLLGFWHIGHLTNIKYTPNIVGNKSNFIK